MEISFLSSGYCVVQRPHTVEQYIAEGKSRRVSSRLIDFPAAKRRLRLSILTRLMIQQLYIMDDQECSELCSCGAETLALSCHALCVPLVPCRTSLAYYSHAAPAYQGEFPDVTKATAKLIHFLLQPSADGVCGNESFWLKAIWTFHFPLPTINWLIFTWLAIPDALFACGRRPASTR